MSQRLADLHPRFRPYAERILELLNELSDGHGQYVVTSTVRSRHQQAQLYAAYQAGRHPLTVAPPGCSKHELGLAVDIASPHVAPKQDDLLASVGRAWQRAGGEWGGVKDPVHFAYPGKLRGCS